MNERLPRWDIVPEMRLAETIPIPDKSDRDWCVIVNYLFGGKGYRTEVLAATFRLSKLTGDGLVIPAEYTMHEIRDTGRELTPHLLVGHFKNVEVRPNFETEVSGGLVPMPFARLEYAYDDTAGEPLGQTKGQDVLVPLNRMRELRLEHF